MKVFAKTGLTLAGLVGLFLAVSSCTQTDKPEVFKQYEFTQPAEKVRIHTWWHWVDGMITKEGITKDLESMKKVGIAQATILNLGFPQNASVLPSENYKIEKVKFVTDKWYEMFEWALQEAKRLGITIGVHNCDGWSESGGPWIKPEMSMKKFVYTKTIIPSGFKGKIKLDKPYNNFDFYKDVAVVAYKNSGLKKNSFQSANPEIIINNQQKIAPSTIFEAKKGDSIEFIFNADFVADKILVFQGYKVGSSGINKNTSSQYTLMSSNNGGESYKEITRFNLTCFNDTAIINFPRTKSSRFKLIISDGLSLSTWRNSKYLLSHVELLADGDHSGFAPAVPRVFEKTASGNILDVKQLDEKGIDLGGYKAIKSNEIVNLSNQMNSDGIIDIDLPDGDWTILRFGYTTTGVVNSPSTVEGEGLECDKMDTTALNVHFSNFPQKLVQHSKGLNGSTFKFLLIDSWECDFQNWTAQMPEEFEKRRGYSLIDWLPVLCGDVVGDMDLSEGFLYDFRKTIAEMIEENFYLHFSELCHRNNLEMHAEVIYGGGMYPPLDVLKANSYADLPMTEFWTLANDGVITYSPLKNNPLSSLASLSGLYNKPVLASEAFTASCRHSETPADLKLYGDRAFCSGINQMVLHSYVHQPNEQKPGLTLYAFGSHFNRNTPWWNYSRGWLDYQARIQYVLQKGIIPAEVLYFVGDQLPHDLNVELVNNLPKDIHAIPCNFDLLQNAVVKEGKISFPSGAEFSILALPNVRSINYSTLIEIDRLVRDGAVVFGEKPQYLLSLKDMTENRNGFEKLMSELWGDYKKGETGRNPHGKGLVCWGASVNDMLKELKVAPALSTTLPDSLEVLSIHKTTPEEDVFFVVNQHNQLLNFECNFAVGDKSLEIWNPMTGECKNQLVYIQSNEETTVPVRLQPNESLFFIFKKGSRKNFVTKVELDGRQIFPAQAEGVSSDVVPEIKLENGNWSLTGYVNGVYHTTTNLGERVSFDAVSPDIYNVSDFSGSVSFLSIGGDSIEPVTISNLGLLTESDVSQIKYFSGEMKYVIDFSVPSEYLDNRSSVCLDLGIFGTTGEVRLNGRFLENVWFPGVTIPVTEILTKHNRLEIVIATTNRNRLIGDLREKGHLNNIWTSYIGVRKGFNLGVSGLAGPLKLIKYSEKPCVERKSAKKERG
ncbi:alpha-L-rhamnosidase [Mariniphaga anaerophila]|uniref:Alpha-L-rhamnosidase n=1 Tax=Mariniphaga anaerophila TaxID=1484053 RepID=A0A1M5FH97_9BACT|nr:glycosyl hydrolase [Mariniphaga anaerophila]SHF90799.1 alpha-L-rhamnosidase [Mariniphaga anaerophila]